MILPGRYNAFAQFPLITGDLLRLGVITYNDMKLGGG